MQKEIALYTSAKVNSEFSWFDIDRDVDPLFKVYVNIFVFNLLTLNFVLFFFIYIFRCG